MGILFQLNKSYLLTAAWGRAQGRGGSSGHRQEYTVDRLPVHRSQTKLNNSWISYVLKKCEIEVYSSELSVDFLKKYFKPVSFHDDPLTFHNI